MELRIGFKGKFEDIQGNLIVDSNDEDREIHNLTANVEINENYQIIHNETEVDLFFKEINSPVYYISKEVSTGPETSTTCIYYHNWQPVDGLYLINNETYEYIIELPRIDFTINEPNNSKNFDKYVSSTNGYSNLTNTLVKNNYVYEWRNNYWYELSNDPNEFKYVTYYDYQTWSDPSDISEIIPSAHEYRDFAVEFDYPGKVNFNYENVINKLSDEQLSNTTSVYDEKGYDEQVKFLNGELESPFHPNIYKYNPIIFNYVTNDGRGSTVDSPVSPGIFCAEKYINKPGQYPIIVPNGSPTMNHPDNPHLESFTKLKAYVSLNNTRDNRWSIVQVMQHQTPEDLNYEVGRFLERIYDRRIWYYQQGKIDEYNSLKGV